MYDARHGKLDTDALEALGIDPMAARSAEEDIEIYADHVHAFEVFRRMRTQWNVGFGDVVGLRYEALPFVMKACGVADEDVIDVLDDVAIMEAEALTIMNKSNG